jgi:hypothetical protein
LLGEVDVLESEKFSGKKAGDGKVDGGSCRLDAFGAKEVYLVAEPSSDCLAPVGVTGVVGVGSILESSPFPFLVKKAEGELSRFFIVSILVSSPLCWKRDLKRPPVDGGVDGTLESKCETSIDCLLLRIGVVSIFGSTTPSLARRFLPKREGMVVGRLGEGDQDRSDEVRGRYGMRSWYRCVYTLRLRLLCCLMSIGSLGNTSPRPTGLLMKPCSLDTDIGTVYGDWVRDVMRDRGRRRDARAGMGGKPRMQPED